MASIASSRVSTWGISYLLHTTSTFHFLRNHSPQHTIMFFFFSFACPANNPSSSNVIGDLVWVSKYIRIISEKNSVISCIYYLLDCIYGAIVRRLKAADEETDFAHEGKNSAGKWYGRYEKIRSEKIIIIYIFVLYSITLTIQKQVNTCIFFYYDAFCLDFFSV